MPMSSLDLKQITDKLNAEFAGADPALGERKLVFWYDEVAEFTDDFGFDI